MAEPTYFRRWPEDASSTYIQARNELLDAEYKLRHEIERVAALRRTLPLGPIMPSYEFEDASINAPLDGRKIQFSDLVKERSLVIKHFMYGDTATAGCPSCSMWIDGFNGVAQHLAQHVDLIVVGKAPAATLQDWARRRGWDAVRLYSCHGTSFNPDLNLEHPDWMPKLDQAPAITVFRRDGDDVRLVYSCAPHFTASEVRGMDLLSPVWNVLDIVPEGRGDWNPSNDYIKEVAKAR